MLNVNESKEKLKAELADRAKRWMQRMERRKKQEIDDSHPKEYMIIKSTSRTTLFRESSSSSVGSSSSRKVISLRDGTSDSIDGSLNSKLSNSAIEEKGKHDKIKVKKESESSSNTIVSRFLNLTKRSRKEKTDSKRAIQQRKAERKAKQQQVLG